MREQWSPSVDTRVLSLSLRRLVGGVRDRVGGLRGEQGGRGGGGHGGGESWGNVQLTLHVLCKMVTPLSMTLEIRSAEPKFRSAPSMIHCWW